MATQYIQPTDEQIRTRAYYLWEADGRPQGRDWEYWLKAKEELARTTSNGNGSSASTATRKATSTTAAEPATKKRSTRSAVFA